MPILIGPLIAGGLSALAGSTFIAGSLFLTAAFVAGTNLALGLLARHLAPKPKFPSLSNLAVPRTQNIKQAIVFRRGLYGEGRVAGPFTFITVTNNKQSLHIITPLLWHESEAVVAYQIDEDIIYPSQLNGDGEVQTGKYSLNGGQTNVVRLRFHNGASGQVADAELLTDVTEVDANFIGEGITYLYTKLASSQSLFNGRIPNISIWLKGAKVLDTRDDITRWNPNPALCMRDYLTDSNYGMETAVVDIDDDETDSAANVCEEFVSTETISNEVSSVDTGGDILEFADERLQLVTGDRVQVTTTVTLPAGLSLATNYYIIMTRYRSNDTLSAGIQLATSYANALAGTQIDITDIGSGTHTINKNAEPRYTSNGAFETDNKHGQILEDLRQSMAGRLLHAGDTWKIRAGAWIAPTITLEQTDMSGPEGLNIRTKHALNDRFNSIKGLFVSPGNDGIPADYPSITNSTYITEDNGRTIFRDIDLPYTNRPHTAQRIVKIELERHRQEFTISCFFTLTALRLQIGDVYNYSNTRMGFSSKAFECAQWKFNLGQDRSGTPLFRTFLAGRETASGVFDWNSGEETLFDLAPNTTLPRPGNPTNPTGLTLQSGDAQLFVKSDGTVVSRIRVSWTSSVDGFVSSYEIQFKKSSDSAWEPVGIAGKDSTQIFIWDVEDGEDYDVRIRSIDHWEKPALTFVTATNHTVQGKSTAPTAVDSFVISRLPDGTRRWEWVNSVVEADVRSGGGYRIRYKTGTASDWDDMTDLHTGLLLASPLESNQLAAGTYDFAIKVIDSSENESTALFIRSAILGDPRLENVLIDRFEHTLLWPGTLTDCYLDDDNVLRVLSDGDWTDLAATWATISSPWKEIIPNKAQFTYETPEIDLGIDVNFTPLVTIVKVGDATIEMRIATDAEGGIPSGRSYTAVSAVTNNRYIQIKVTIDAVNSIPESTSLSELVILLDGEVVLESFEDVDTSLDSAAPAFFEHIVPGHFRILASDMQAISQARITALQNVGAGWTWEQISKSASVGSLSPAAEFKVYNGSDVLADATVDIELKGPKSG